MWRQKEERRKRKEKSELLLLLEYVIKEPIIINPDLLFPNNFNFFLTPIFRTWNIFWKKSSFLYVVTNSALLSL